MNDATKEHERTERGMGDERWFLTPEGMVQPREVPAGWGLLEVHRTARGARGYYLKRTVEALPRERTMGSLAAERLLLVSVAQRALAALEQVRPLSLGDVEVPEPILRGEYETNTVSQGSIMEGTLPERTDDGTDQQ